MLHHLELFSDATCACSLQVNERELDALQALLAAQRPDAALADSTKALVARHQAMKYASCCHRLPQALGAGAAAGRVPATPGARGCC